MRNFLVQKGFGCSLVLGLLVLASCREAIDGMSRGESPFARADPSLMLVTGSGASGGPSPVPQSPSLSHDASGPGSDFDFGNAVYALPDQRLLRLGSQLQIIDIRDPSAPRQESSLALDDYPVSLHVAGERVIVLSNAKEYWGERTDIDYAWGARITSIDISDREHPKLLARVSARGWLVSGILKNHGADPLAMYVALAAKEPTGAHGPGTGVTEVASFSIDRDSGAITLRTEHELPELDALRLHASAAHLTVLGREIVGAEQVLRAVVFDASSADAQLRALGQLPIAGAKVADRQALDVRGSVLRVISSGWGGYRPNVAPAGAETEHHVETFDLADGRQLARIDHCSFQGTNQLDRSVFVSAGALIVGVAVAGTNSIAQDVRAIAIDEQGQCRDLGSPQLQDMPSVLRETQAGSRLLTISELHEPNATSYTPQWRVLLYDVTDLAAAKLLAELHVKPNTQRYADPDSVDVFEAAPQVASADGTAETGLLLLTPSASDLNRTSQLVSFSEHTLTSRGGVVLMPSEDALLVSGSTLAALSPVDLTLLGDAAQLPPQRLGTLRTVGYTSLAIYDLGDYQLHVRALDLRSGQMQLQVTQLPTLAAASAVSTLDLPEGMGGRVDRVGDLVLHSSRQGHVTVYDYSDPRQPRKRGEAEANIADETFRASFALGEIDVFATTKQRSQDLGTAKHCTTRPPVASPDDPEPTYHWGQRSCTIHASGAEECFGSLLLCERATNACTTLTTDPPGSRTECLEQSETRSWFSTTVRALDLRNADAPRFLAPIAMPERSRADHVIADGHTLYVSWYEPDGDADDPSVFVREFVTQIDLTDPDAVRVNEPVNVPGRVLGVLADSLITEAPDQANAGVSLARVRIDGGKAMLERTLELPAGKLDHLEIDHSGRLLAVTQPTEARNRALGAAESVMLFVIEPDALSVLGSLSIDRDVRWIEAAGDRAAFQLGGGVLVVDYADPAAPFAYTYLPNLYGLHFDGNYVYTGESAIDARIRQHIQE